MSRALYLDEDLPLRVAVELTARGRPATALRRDPGAPTRDRELIRALATRDVVLVTGDAGLPREHGALLAQTRLPVALVDATRGEAHKREVLHRWAHLMAAQPPGTVRRYGRRGPTRVLS
jgi:predicted nuclease of predicted toxin-antitoxin system